MPQKVLVNTKLSVLMSPGRPIILPKYNLFNMVAVLVKRSIDHLSQEVYMYVVFFS